MGDRSGSSGRAGRIPSKLCCAMRCLAKNAADLSWGDGRVAEWLMAPVLKTGVPERVSGVRIPPLPPLPYPTLTISAAGSLHSSSSLRRRGRHDCWHSSSSSLPWPYPNVNSSLGKSAAVRRCFRVPPARVLDLIHVSAGNPKPAGFKVGAGFGQTTVRVVEDADEDHCFAFRIRIFPGD